MMVVLLDEGKENAQIFHFRRKLRTLFIQGPKIDNYSVLSDTMKDEGHRSELGTAELFLAHFSHKAIPNSSVQFAHDPLLQLGIHGVRPAIERIQLRAGSIDTKPETNIFAKPF